jgi:hypothetical protein
MNFDICSNFLSVIKPTLNSSSLVNMHHTIFDSFLVIAIIDFPVPFAVFMASYRSISRHDSDCQLLLIPRTS